RSATVRATRTDKARNPRSPTAATLLSQLGRRRLPRACRREAPRQAPTAVVTTGAAGDDGSVRLDRGPSPHPICRLALVLTALGFACGAPARDLSGTGGATGAGGRSSGGSGGAVSSGGTTGPGTGGASGSVGTGGSVGAAGSVGSGGTVGSG